MATEEVEKLRWLLKQVRNYIRITEKNRLEPNLFDKNRSAFCLMRDAANGITTAKDTIR